MKRRSLLFAASLLVIVATAIWLRHSPLRRPPAISPRPPAVLPSASPPAPTTPGISVAPANRRDADSLLDRAARELAALPLAQRRARVQQLLRELALLPAGQRSDTIVNFLHTGVDVVLPGEFLLGPGGWLRDWPTFRQALFDYLAQFDSATARFVAQEILTHPPADQPGQWALALRELARGHPATDWSPVVASRMVDLLNNPEWARDAPRAYLEAFDVIVAGRATSLLPELSRLSVTGGHATRFAAFVSADRLMLAAPAATLAELQRTPSLFGQQPQIRAGLFARADLRDSAQTTALNAYFAREDVPPAERSAFAALFPLYDLTVSNNLLTAPTTRSLADMQAHDRLAIAALSTWTSDPHFAAWQDAFAAINNRLQQQLSVAKP
ncbi:hypothetical protein K0B96_14280 [Horticoccus luteus]|uniref:Uncharacterized protein n=1 Tax=Horticoccus luteus TaxID=2862869 RepID=A0A8F9TVQ2_9BACT|nr:hypothetical protein [Horticoccus luteus]QYM78452.1 hypothetical protein K0B96_14280 [Horticoccus luteus]